MSYDQALRLTSILLASISFLALVMGANLPAWLGLLTGVALILALVRTGESKTVWGSARHAARATMTGNVLVISGFFFFWIDSLWISGDLFLAGVHFLLVLLVIKLGHLQGTRDSVHLYALSLVAILAVASLTADLWYLSIFLAYLVIGVWTLVLLQVVKFSQNAGDAAIGHQGLRQMSHSEGRVNAQLFWLVNGLVAATFCLTLVMFFVMPRVGVGFYQKQYGANIRTSGFSNTVDLGSIGPIKRDQSIVMRVELPDQMTQGGSRLYLRGAAFDRYDGRSWANQLSHRRFLTETSPGTFARDRSHAAEELHLGPPLRQKILLEPLDTPVLFAAPFAEEISGKLPAVQMDIGGALYVPFASSTRIEYMAVSRTNPVVPADLVPEPTAYPEAVFRYFLQVPARSDRIAALAQEIIQNKHSAYEQALAIEEYLLRNYRYSLDVPVGHLVNPLEEFLFNRKTGYCEHYATAMVILLRTIGIPARLITGFLATEWNEYGNYYVVRQQDAHVWVEVYLPHSGWIMMDPTPPSDEDLGGTTSAGQVWERILDSLRLRWTRIFVQYTAADQLAVVRGLQASGITAGNKAWNSISAMLEPLASGFEKATGYATGVHLIWVVEGLALAAIGLGLLLWRGRKRARKKGSWLTDNRFEEPAVSRLYRAMIGHLATRGYPKPAGMGPVEFVGMLRRRWADAVSPVEAITELYCRARFGRRPLTPEEYQCAQNNLRRLMELEWRGPGVAPE